MLYRRSFSKWVHSSLLSFSLNIRFFLQSLGSLELAGKDMTGKFRLQEITTKLAKDIAAFGNLVDVYMKQGVLGKDQIPPLVDGRLNFYILQYKLNFSRLQYIRSVSMPSDAFWLNIEKHCYLPYCS